MIVGAMLLFTVQALGELAVLYPVNGAFFTYGCRFIDEAWYASKTLQNEQEEYNNIIQGLCYGMGLRDRMAYGTAIRNHRCRYHHLFLERRYQHWCLDCCLPLPPLYSQLLWSPRIWRRCVK